MKLMSLELQDLEPSQVAFGGADPQRMLEPITWSKAATTMPSKWIFSIGKTIGKAPENGDFIGKPGENHGNMVIS